MNKVTLISTSLLFATGLLASACSSTQKVALLSTGELEGKTIPANPQGEIREGESCGGLYSLSDAVRSALEGTSYDTLLDSDVTNSTGLFLWSNCIHVKGQAVKSSDFK